MAFVAECLLFMSLLLSSSTVSIALSTDKPIYNVISRRKLQSHRVNHYEDQDILSFDGDIVRIKQLALAKALETAESNPPLRNKETEDEVLRENEDQNTGVVYTSPSPVAPTSIACGGIDTDIKTLTWQYSVETSPSAVIETIIPLIEQALLESIAPKLLECLNPQASEANINGLKTLPIDRKLDLLCSPERDPTNVCSVFDGEMELSLSGEDNLDEAVFKALSVIKTSLETPEFVNTIGSGVEKVTYIGPDIINRPPILGDHGHIVPDAENSLGTASVVLVAIGSAAIVLLVTSVYVWKQGNRSRSQDESGEATQAAGSSGMMLGYDVTNPNNLETLQRMPSSPFSEMLPAAYRFTDNMSILSGQGGMSAILEDDEAQSSSSGIVISEGGFSSDAEGGSDSHEGTSPYAFDMRDSTYGRASPLLLGARKSDHTQGHISLNSNISSPMLLVDTGDDITSNEDESQDLEASPPPSPKVAFAPIQPDESMLYI